VLLNEQNIVIRGSYLHLLKAKLEKVLDLLFCSIGKHESTNRLAR
jgi:hypothetical protein